MPTLCLDAPTLLETHRYVTLIRAHVFTQYSRKYGFPGGVARDRGGEIAPPDTEHVPSEYQRMYPQKYYIPYLCFHSKYTIQSENLKYKNQRTNEHVNNLLTECNRLNTVCQLTLCV
jgi:hypothetical protein